MIEFIIFGIDGRGKVYPVERGMCLCIQLELAAYKKKYPPVIRIQIDCALPLEGA